MSTKPIGRRPIDLDFSKKKPEEVSAILDRRVEAVINRLTAVWEVRDLHDNLSEPQKAALTRLGLRINWIQRRIETVRKFEKKDLDSILWGFKQIGEISFKGLRQNYWKVVGQLVAIHDNGYFDCIDTTK